MNMDEVSRGLDEIALGSADIAPHLEEGHVAFGVEACGCAELARNESTGALSTPLHRCKGRHHLPIIGEEMQGDQLPRGSKLEEGSKSDPQADPKAHDLDQKPVKTSSLQAQHSQQTSSHTAHHNYRRTTPELRKAAKTPSLCQDDRSGRRPEGASGLVAEAGYQLVGASVEGAPEGSTQLNRSEAEAKEEQIHDGEELHTCSGADPPSVESE